MKTHFPSLVLCGLLGATAAVAQVPPAPPAWQSMKILQLVDPIFPYALQQLSVTHGEARVVINVDPDGKLTDWLVVGYTMPEFADAAVAALRRWKYVPAQLRGEPVGATAELVFHFETQGTLVVSQNAMDNLQARTLRLLAGAYAYRPCTLQELDRIPTPIYTVSPLYPADLAAKGGGGRVSIDFYIDEKGEVRMPACSPTEDSLLTALSIAALRQWRFEPPTRNGRPVLVRATQVFNFGATGAGGHGAEH